MNPQIEEENFGVPPINLKEMIRAVIIQSLHSGGGFLNCDLSSFPSLHIVGQANSVLRGIEVIRDAQPDLVLLDVDFPGESAFTVFEATQDLKFEKIILSEQSRYLFKAFRFDVFEYLLKPLVPRVLDSCLKRLQSERGELQIQRMYQKKFLQELNIDYAVFSTAEKERLVSVRRLVRVEATDEGAIVILDNGERFTTQQSFRQVRKKLRHSGMFVLDRQHLIRLRSEIEIIPGPHGTLCQLVDGACLEVPTEKVDALRAEMDALMPEAEPTFNLMKPPRHDRPGKSFDIT